MDTIGERIAHRRKELGLTQDQLAETLNISSKTVSRWETGKQIPDAVSLLEIAKALNMTISAMYGIQQNEEVTSHTTVTAREKAVHNRLPKKTIKIATALIIIIVVILDLVIGAFNRNLTSKVIYTAEEVPMYKLISHDHSAREWIEFCNTRQEKIHILSRLKTDAETKQSLACYLIYFPQGCEDTEFQIRYRLGLNGKVLELDFKNTTNIIDDTYYLCYLEMEYTETEMLFLQTYLDGKRVDFSDVGNVMNVNWDNFNLRKEG